jgi:hypothetical protein
MRRVLKVLFLLLPWATLAHAQGIWINAASIIFSHRQGTQTSGGPGTSGSVVLANAPLQGDVVCLSLNGGTLTALTVKDANNNVYAVSPHSPGTITGFNVWLACLANAPAGASATINMSWTGSSQWAVWIDDFTVQNGPAAFDTDAVQSNGTAGSSTALITSPTITPSTPHELLYAGAIPNSSLNAPLAGTPFGLWMGSAGSLGSGGLGMAEYILNASTPTAVDFLDSTASDPYGAVAIAFK